jgi:hypothetical protein
MYILVRDEVVYVKQKAPCDIPLHYCTTGFFLSLYVDNTTRKIVIPKYSTVDSSHCQCGYLAHASSLVARNIVFC